MFSATRDNALMGKWSWHFAKERGTLSYSMISGKYGVEEGGCCSCIVIGNIWGLESHKDDWDVVGSRVAFKEGELLVG